MLKKKPRINLNFRQSARSFKGAIQATVWSRINRNMPYRIFHISKEMFLKGKSKLRNLRTEKQKNEQMP